jgi:hypothetical protein
MGLITITDKVRRDLASQGFAWIPRPAWSLGPRWESHWQRLCGDWDHLELDLYLAEGTRFRLRRYGRYFWSPANDELAALPHEPYFQPVDENRYAGGIERDFALLLPETVHNPFLHALVRSTFACLPVAVDRGDASWEVRIHQIRTVASAKVPGLPAPEGIHQDGTDFLTLHLVRRQNIVGGESTIYDLKRRPLQRFTMREPLDSMILQDPRIMHGVTPVVPADGRTIGIRDILGIDFIFSPDLQRPNEHRCS